MVQSDSPLPRRKSRLKTHFNGVLVHGVSEGRSGCTPLPSVASTDCRAPHTAPSWYCGTGGAEGRTPLHRPYCTTGWEGYKLGLQILLGELRGSANMSHPRTRWSEKGAGTVVVAFLYCPPQRLSCAMISPECHSLNEQRFLTPSPLRRSLRDGC
jgi:hypothetical protein